jgi:hypothetical protein
MLFARSACTGGSTSSSAPKRPTALIRPCNVAFEAANGIQLGLDVAWDVSEPGGPARDGKRPAAMETLLTSPE